MGQQRILSEAEIGGGLEGSQSPFVQSAIQRMSCDAPESRGFRRISCQCVMLAILLSFNGVPDRNDLAFEVVMRLFRETEFDEMPQIPLLRVA